MIFLDRTFKHERMFGGGGSPQAQQIDSSPVPLPAPPVTTNNKASLQAEHDYAMRMQQQKTVRKTIITGDTGGYKPAPPAGPTGPTGPRF